jgi:signal transduction histidine kinase
MPEFHRARSEGQPSSGQHIVLHKNGEPRLVERHISPVLNPAGQSTHWVVIQRDLTQIKRLEKEILEISEREQQRIGQDLHDGLGQQLTAIELMCESLRSDLAAIQPDLERQATQICRFLREAVAQTRSLAHGLAPFKVETEGLETALKELAQSTAALGRVKCSLRCISPVVVPGRETAGHLYRIAQEAVNNAVKHSKASEVVIHLSRKDAVLRLQVKDNGKGLPKTTKLRQGIGLSVMKHRASLIGAELEVESQLARGVTVTCTLRSKT